MVKVESHVSWTTSAGSPWVDPFVLDTEATELEQRGDGYVVETVSGGKAFSVEARVEMNSAGLHADTVAVMTGIEIDEAGNLIQHYR